MDIRIGDVVKFRKKPDFQETLGVVKEIAVIKESSCDKRVGNKQLVIGTYDKDLSECVLREEDIIKVYMKYDETMTALDRIKFYLDKKGFYEAIDFSVEANINDDINYKKYAIYKIIRKLCDIWGISEEELLEYLNIKRNK
ncbi:hypothetical protein [Clostridium butyricum]|uniref:hypothetical protein n=1 Tax=Clostridium butyricum TaxID=1492 RepID=UPI002AAF6DE0|nr:hypothetical protein [Clostridium butyricum]